MKNATLEIKRIVQEGLNAGDHQLPLHEVRLELMQMGFLPTTADRKIKECAELFGWRISQGYLKY
jgi:hypothetical protein